jgi:hypothetical protein
MKRIVCLFALLAVIAGVCHAQNGPTQHSATLSWIQSTSSGVKFNCVYRGAAVGNYTIPALFCSTSPITLYKDLSVVAGTTYHYAVTASDGTTESAFSNDVAAAIPNNVAAPSGLSLSLVAKLRKLPKLPKDMEDRILAMQAAFQVDTNLELQVDTQ